MSEHTDHKGRKAQSKGANLLVVRPLTVEGRTVQVRLEPSYWEAVDEICRREGLSITDLCGDISRRVEERKRRRPDGELERVSLANALRVFVVNYFRQAATEIGHSRAGHGRGDPFAMGIHPAAPPALRH